MNILDLKRRAQGFHFLDNGGGGYGDVYRVDPAQEAATYASGGKNPGDYWVAGTTGRNGKAGYWANPKYNTGGGFLDSAINSVGNIGMQLGPAAPLLAAAYFGGPTALSAITGGGAATGMPAASSGAMSAAGDFGLGASTAATGAADAGLGTAAAGAGTGAATGFGGVGTDAAVNGASGLYGNTTAANSFLDPAQMAGQSLQSGGFDLGQSALGSNSALASQYAPATNSVLADSAAGTAGYGASSAGAGGAAAGTPAWQSTLESLLPQLGKTAVNAVGVNGALNQANGNNQSAGQVSQANGQLLQNMTNSNNQIDATNKAISSIPTVSSLFGQDSPYAQDLMKRLQAKDAAAGANSQYGPRFANYEAQLAGQAQNYATSYGGAVGNLTNSISNLYNGQTNMANGLNGGTTQQNNLTNNANVLTGQSLGSLYNTGSNLYNAYQSSGAPSVLSNIFSGSA